MANGRPLVERVASLPPGGVRFKASAKRRWMPQLRAFCFLSRDVCFACAGGSGVLERTSVVHVGNRARDAGELLRRKAQGRAVDLVGFVRDSSRKSEE